MSTSSADSLSLHAIAAAQAAGHISAFDKDFARRDLARLQSLYAAKIEQREAMRYVFDEGAPTIILRSASRELPLQLGEAGQELYQPIVDALDEGLRKLETQIVQAHITLAREVEQGGNTPPRHPDYEAAILRLCTEPPAEPRADGPEPTTPEPSRQRTTSTTTAVGSSSSYGAAAAA